MLDTIRGRSYEEALMILEYSPYRACELITKTLVSVRTPPCLLHPSQISRLLLSRSRPDCSQGHGFAANQ